MRGVGLNSWHPDGVCPRVPAVAPTWGPLGRSVDNVLTALRTLLDGPRMNALDPTIAPVPFDDKVSAHILFPQSLCSP